MWNNVDTETVSRLKVNPELSKGTGFRFFVVPGKEAGTKDCYFGSICPVGWKWITTTMTETDADRWVADWRGCG